MLSSLVSDTRESAVPVRRDFAIAIRQVPIPHFRRLLIPLLNDPNPEVAEEAMRSTQKARRHRLHFCPDPDIPAAQPAAEKQRPRTAGGFRRTGGSRVWVISCGIRKKTSGFAVTFREPSRAFPARDPWISWSKRLMKRTDSCASTSSPRWKESTAHQAGAFIQPPPDRIADSGRKRSLHTVPPAASDSVRITEFPAGISAGTRDGGKDEAGSGSDLSPSEPALPVERHCRRTTFD